MGRYLAFTFVDIRTAYKVRAIAQRKFEAIGREEFSLIAFHLILVETQLLTNEPIQRRFVKRFRMIIANPIYDVAFKFLMDDDRVAKFFIGTILEEQIEDVSLNPQKLVYKDDSGAGFAIFRLDFIATVRTATGELKKVLIEIQKAKNAIDLMRFRRYLGEQYKKQDEVNGKKVVLPIVTIYLLGFDLPEIESCVVKVNRQYVDLETHEILHQKSEFIENLSHDCYVVQLGRIKSKFQTKLDKLLSVFEQNYFFDENKILKEYKHEADNPSLALMINKLHYMGTAPLEKKKIEDEEEAHRVFEVFFGATLQELEGKIAQNEKAIEEKEKVIEEKDKALEENARTLEENAKLIQELKRKLGLD
jgi:hypothetical protein